nr:hypothetical protein [Rhizobium oryzihabitans]
MARLKMSSFSSARSSLLASVALLVLVPGAQAFDRTGPAGQGYAITVPEPTATYPLPLADNYRNQTGKNEKGRRFAPMMIGTTPSSKSSPVSTASGRLAMKNGRMAVPMAMVRRISAM